MKIQNIKINAYGNVKDKEIEFKDINIIYGKNESGKSTILNYIKNSFYGISKNKNGKDISDYDRYKPWVGEDFSGKIKYKLNNGSEFEIFRDFNKKNPVIYNSRMENISKDFDIDKKEGSQFFFEHTGIDENVFTSTVLSEQQEVKLSDAKQSALIQKITNMAGSGDANLSYFKAKEKLNKKILEEIGTDRTIGKPINIVRKKIKEIENKINELNDAKQNKQFVTTEKNKLKNKIEEKETRKELLKEISTLNKNNKIDKERINYQNKIIQEKIDKIEHLREEKEDLKIVENKSINKFFIGIFIFLIILNIINFIYVRNNIIKYILLSFIPIAILIFLLLKNKEKNKEKKRIENEQKLINKQIEYIQREIEDLEKDINKSKYTIKENEESIKNKYNIELYEIENSEKELETIINEINSDKIRLNTIEIEEKNITNNLEEIISLNEENDVLKEQLSELEKKNYAINLTKDFLENAHEKMKKNISPKLTENLSKTMEKITDGKYKKINISEENGIIVELENGDYKTAEKLSVGTIDQLYLSLRISMIDDISNEKIPIFLDESFAYFDDERLENILKYLIEQYGDHQLIIFTSTKREEDIMRNLNKEFNLITL